MKNIFNLVIISIITVLLGCDMFSAPSSTSWQNQAEKKFVGLMDEVQKINSTPYVYTTIYSELFAAEERLNKLISQEPPRGDEGLKFIDNFDPWFFMAKRYNTFGSGDLITLYAIGCEGKNINSRIVDLSTGKVIYNKTRRVPNEQDFYVKLTGNSRPPGGDYVAELHINGVHISSWQFSVY